MRSAILARINHGKRTTASDVFWWWDKHLTAVSQSCNSGSQVYGSPWEKAQISCLHVRCQWGRSATFRTVTSSCSVRHVQLCTICLTVICRTVLPVVYTIQVLLSWCTAVFTVWHLGTSLTISLLPLMSLRGFVCIPQTDISLLYLAVDSVHTAVGRFRLPVQRSGIRCRASWEIQRVVLAVLNSFSRQSFLVSTNVTRALEVF